MKSQFAGKPPVINPECFVGDVMNEVEPKAYDIELDELDACVAELNRELGDIGQSLSAALEKFNRKTHGHAVDVAIRLDWHRVLSPTDFLGSYLLARCELSAKAIDLPQRHRL